MCRMVCSFGRAVTLSELLIEPEHSLLEQAHAPRYQTHGTMNADGFGVGWFDRSRSAVPAVYRRPVPIWSDRTFRSIAPLIASDVVLAAVRSATPPLPVHEFNTPPYASGPWLFAHNGAIADFAGEAGVALRRTLPADRAAAIEGSTDSETLFALVLTALDRGAEPGEALMQAISCVESVTSGRMTMLMTDGVRVAAVTYGDSLFVRDDSSASIIASEPFGGDEAWRAVPDRSVVEAGGGPIRIRPLQADGSQRETA